MLLQEEERERRMDFIPEESAVNTDSIEVDRDTLDMLKSINMGSLPGVSAPQVRSSTSTAGRSDMLATASSALALALCLLWSASHRCITRSSHIDSLCCCQTRMCVLISA
jgi:hypothetical protein